MQQQVWIIIDKNPNEIEGSRITRFGWFSVSCERCKDILLQGKYLDGETDEQIWRAIRYHVEEHMARELQERNKTSC